MGGKQLVLFIERGIALGDSFGFRCAFDMECGSQIRLFFNQGVAGGKQLVLFVERDISLDEGTVFFHDLGVTGGSQIRFFLD